MTAPVRLRLSRARGFDLQAHSRATNGLACISVARPGRWGNRYRPAAAYVDHYVRVPPITIEDSIRLHCEWLTGLLEGAHGASLRAELEGLRGYNLACWCPTGQPCHADTLLRLANPPGQDA